MIPTAKPLTQEELNSLPVGAKLIEVGRRDGAEARVCTIKRLASPPNNCPYCENCDHLLADQRAYFLVDLPPTLDELIDEFFKNPRRTALIRLQAAMRRDAKGTERTWRYRHNGLDFAIDFSADPPACRLVIE